ALLAGHAAEAVQLFSEALRIRPEPTTLYNRARAYQWLGNYPGALDDLEAFARDASPELKARVRNLDELMADVRTHVSTLELTCNVEGAQVRIGDRSLGVTPLPAKVRVNAGPQLVEISKEGA